MAKDNKMLLNKEKDITTTSTLRANRIKILYSLKFSVFLMGALKYGTIYQKI